MEHHRHRARHREEEFDEDELHPCLRCGACCAYFRVSFYWREAEKSEHEKAVPEGFWEEGDGDTSAERESVNGTIVGSVGVERVSASGAIADGVGVERVSAGRVGVSARASGAASTSTRSSHTSLYRTMKGTGVKHHPKCVALKGQVGELAFCSIYENRPSPCRKFEASYENGVQNKRCDEARRAHGLKPLTKDDWRRYNKKNLSPK